MFTPSSSFNVTENNDSIEFNVTPSPMPASLGFLIMVTLVGPVSGMFFWGFGVGPALAGVGLHLGLALGTRMIVNSFRKPYTVTVSKDGFVSCKGQTIDGANVTGVAIRNRYLRKGELPQIPTHNIKVTYDPRSSMQANTARALIVSNALSNGIASGFNSQTRAGAKANFELVTKSDKGKETLLAMGLTDLVAINLMNEVSLATEKVWGAKPV